MESTLEDKTEGGVGEDGKGHEGIVGPASPSSFLPQFNQPFVRSFVCCVLFSLLGMLCLLLASLQGFINYLLAQLALPWY